MLEQLLGSEEVYFQAPDSSRMNYPAIVYSIDKIRNVYADNKVYSQLRNYKVTVMDEDPESEVMKKISMLPRCRFDTSYKSDNLNHFVFTLNY